MLAILGLLGAVMAGVAADALMAAPKEDQPDDDGDLSEDFDSPQATDEGGADAGDDLLSYVPEGDVIPSDPLSLSGSARDDLMSGGTGGDTLLGGEGDDQIDGRDGDDMLRGQSGDDTLHGQEGDDTLVGGAGDDVGIGGAGDDRQFGGAGDDSLSGQEGDDILTGGEGDDTLVGGDGQDTLNGGTGNDWLTGGYGDDLLSGSEGADTLDGGAGADTLWGQDGWQDFLNGGAGDDHLHLGQGDLASGGEGADSFFVDLQPGADGLATISDYAPGEDEIVVMYDATAHPAPEITVVSEPGSPDATLYLDGVPLAQVTGGAGLDPATIRLVPETMAA